MSDNLDFLGAAGNLISSVGGAFFENTLGRQNEERQWNKYFSPKAQVENLAAAGINPAVAMGNQSPVLTAGGQMQMPQVSPFGIGTTALSDIGNYLNAKALAAKTEKETGKVDVETRKALSELEAQNLQNDLVRQFGKQKWTYDLAQSYQNILLAQKTNDLKEQEKVMNEYHKVTSYIESVLKGDELTAFRKRLGNLDKEIELSNKLQSEKINTEKSQQGALAASANASNASAELSRQQAKTEDDLREVRKFAIDLGNHMQGLEYGFNIDTYQSRLDKFASDVGIAKWTSYLTQIEAQDRAAYNAVQRIIMGKGTKEDGKTLWNFINDGRQLIPFK